MQARASASRGFLAGTLAMALVVAASNILVQFPINNWLTWGAFSYPVSFFVNDLTNRRLGCGVARRVVMAGFIVGVVLSFILATPRIALASGGAFLVAQLLDTQIFDRLRHAAWWQPPFISSIVASLPDTALFFGIAFAGTGLPWVSWAVGDYLVKFLVAVVLLLPFRALLSLVVPLPASAADSS